MKDIPQQIEHYLTEHLPPDASWTVYAKLLILLLLLLVVCYISHWLTKKIFQSVIGRLVAKTKTEWDDIFFEQRTFAWLANVIPALIFKGTITTVFIDFEHWHTGLRHLSSAFIAIVIIGALNSVIESIREIMKRSENFRDKPIASYIQLGKIFLYFLGGILVISILLGKNPLVFLSAMGALSAVLLLIFKDTILGFVASIHISVNDMVRVGDWVSMEKFGADGDVLEINLATVKVKNWDLTITTIPTYAFVSDSFKNWRGMTESGGRRIKRAVYINKNSIKHVNEELLERLMKIELIKDFLQNRLEEIKAYNEKNNIAVDSPANGRRLTNIGVFRYYLEHYIKKNPNINTEMTCMVRQLDPTPNGLPIEIYAFSKDKRWVYFESIMADIFDHVFAVAPVFELSFFQNPSGADFKSLTQVNRES